MESFWNKNKYYVGLGAGILVLVVIIIAVIAGAVGVKN